MSIASELAKRQLAASEATFCKLGVIRNYLPFNEQEALDYAIELCRKDAATTPQGARIFTVQWLTKTLNDNGYAVGKTVVSDHLRKACACESH